MIVDGVQHFFFVATDAAHRICHLKSSAKEGFAGPRGGGSSSSISASFMDGSLFSIRCIFFLRRTLREVMGEWLAVGG